jgi:hypothetical protein
MTDPTIALATSERAFHSSQSSAVVRSLALTAVGVVWLFAGGLSDRDASPERVLNLLKDSNGLLLALNFALLALALDAMQYISAAFLWSLYRWGLDQITVNDLYIDPSSGEICEVSTRARLGWFIARLSGFAGHLEDDRIDREAVSWKARRGRLRVELYELERRRSRSASRRPVHRSGRGAVEVKSSKPGNPWAPAWINWPGLLCYSLKVISLAVSYVFLGSFLLRT